VDRRAHTTLQESTPNPAVARGERHQGRHSSQEARLGASLSGKVGEARTLGKLHDGLRFAVDCMDRAARLHLLISQKVNVLHHVREYRCDGGPVNCAINSTVDAYTSPPGTEWALAKVGDGVRRSVLPCGWAAEMDLL
jgi:hypothetical protein